MMGDDHGENMNEVVVDVNESCQQSLVMTQVADAGR
jgi:hypothetical protein